MPEPAAHAPVSTDPCVVLPERRCAERLPCPELPPVRYLVRPSMQQGMAVLSDFSAQGVGLRMRCPPEPGATLFLQLPGPRRGATHTRLARVAHVTPLSADTWLVGCRLTPPLSDQDLARLLPLFTGASG